MTKAYIFQSGEVIVPLLKLRIPVEHLLTLDVPLLEELHPSKTDPPYVSACREAALTVLNMHLLHVY